MPSLDDIASFWLAAAWVLWLLDKLAPSLSSGAPSRPAWIGVLISIGE